MSDSEQIVHRHIPLSGHCDKDKAVPLHEINGVQQAECRQQALKLVYDVREINLSTTEAQLKTAGLQEKSTLVWRIKRAFYRYVDDNIRATSGSTMHRRKLLQQSARHLRQP